MVTYLHIIYRGTPPTDGGDIKSNERRGRWSGKQAPMLKLYGFTADELLSAISRSVVDVVLSTPMIDPVSGEVHYFVFPGVTWLIDHAGFERQLTDLFCPSDGFGFDNLGVIGTPGGLHVPGG